MTPDFYEVLGVARFSAPKVVHAAYRRKARELHPDSRLDSATASSETGETAGLTMATVNEAWRVLGDPGRRAEYDLALGLSSGNREGSSSSRYGGAPSGGVTNDQVAPSSPLAAVTALCAAFGSIMMALGFASRARSIVVFGSLLLFVGGLLWALRIVNAMRPPGR
jgi:curved DNA-binding protein CbpA